MKSKSPDKTSEAAGRTVRPDERSPEGQRELGEMQHVLGNRRLRALLQSGGAGEPLPRPVRETMEAAFGADFSSVRVHEGSHVRDLGAVALTRGTEIHFAPGRFRPGTSAGDHLIGHELAHVVQQHRGVAGTGVIRAAHLERQADDMAAAAVRGEPVRSGTVVNPQPSAGGAIQLKEEDDIVAAPPDLLHDAKKKSPFPRLAKHHHHDDKRVYAKALEKLDEIPTTWFTIVHLQTEVLRGISELAKESEKPSFDQELLVALCNIALSAALGGIGSWVASRVEKIFSSQLLKAVIREVGFSTTGMKSGDLSQFSEFLAPGSVEVSKNLAKWFAEAVKDSIVKQAGKELLGPKIKELLPSRGPRIAYFEGLASGYILAARDAYRESRSQMTEIRTLMAEGRLSAVDALILAAGMLRSLDLETARSQATTQREATDGWLTYLARQARGGAGPEGFAHSGSETERDIGTNLASNKDTFKDTAGVLYLDVQLARDGRPFIEGGHVEKAGSGLVALLRDRPIEAIRMPKIFRIRYEQAPSGSGPSFRGQFEIRQTERGGVFIPREILSHEAKQWLLKLAGKPLSDIVVPGASGGLTPGYEGTEADLVRGAHAFLEQIATQHLSQTLVPG